MIREDIDSGNSNFESYRQRITNFSNDFEFGVFIFLLRKSLWFLVVATLLGAVCAFLYLRYTPNVYQSKSVIQINITNQAADILNVGYGFEGVDELKTQVELIRSPMFG